MLLTDRNGPMSLQPRSPGLGRVSRSVRFAAPAALFLCCATFGATISLAQDHEQSVAEAARQERARKQELQKRAKHVYTEEDLKHPSILTPEDRAQVEAKRNECAQKNNCSPAQNPPASLDANSQTPQIPLGEVARQLRKQKELQALKPKQAEPFHLPFGTPALASPILSERPSIRPPAQPVIRPRTPSNVFRRDPFSAVPIRPDVPRLEARRPEVHPEVQADVHATVRKSIRPTIHPKVSNDAHPKVREDLFAIIRPSVHPDFGKHAHPTLRVHNRLTAVPPKISSRLARPGILIRPMQPSAPARPAQAAASVSTIRLMQPQPVLSPAATATQKTVGVQRGDSLWKLAQQNLGRGNRWHELLTANPHIADPNQIRAGVRLNLPAVVAATVSGPSPHTAATIKVHKGDTLWSLAKSNLGRSSAWHCLAQANPGVLDPNRIYENQELFVPTGCQP